MDLLLIIIAIIDAFILFSYCLFFFTGYFYRHSYDTRMKKKYDMNYFPGISIFIPCKGTGPGFSDNISSMIRLCRDNIHLYFVVESENDPAYDVITSLIDGRRGCRCIVAGPASTCSQKNHNLIAGINAAGKKDDVYIFLDSDITLSIEQIRALVVPLSNPGIHATSGFQWNIIEKNTFVNNIYSFMVATQWYAMNTPLIKSIWGGATAITRRVFEELDMETCWSKTVVDDMTLQKRLLAFRKKSVYVPHCINESVRSMDTLKNALMWFKRQVLFVRIYQFHYWFSMACLLLFASLNFIGVVPFILATLVTRSLSLAFITMITVFFSLSIMTFCVSVIKPGKDKTRPLLWFFQSPAFILICTLSTLLSAFTRTLHWSGITYKLDYRGKVLKVIR